MRILGIDYGEARTGVAVSDPMGWTAQGLSTIHEKDPQKVAAQILEYINTYQPTKIVIGLPKNMDGTEGFRAQATKSFGALLESMCALPIVYWDERLSTVAAARTLKETNVRGGKRNKVLDTVAATYILQGYLDKNF